MQSKVAKLEKQRLRDERMAAGDDDDDNEEEEEEEEEDQNSKVCVRERDFLGKEREILRCV